MASKGIKCKIKNLPRADLIEPDRLKLSCDEPGRCLEDDVELTSFNDDVVDDFSSAAYLDKESRNKHLQCNMKLKQTEIMKLEH